jgi:cell division protein FtsL
MVVSDYIALSALLMGIISALSAFIYWLVSMSYKISRFIYDLRSDVSDIKHTVHEYEKNLQDLSRQVKYLNHIAKKEFPQYFKREEDRDETDN